jgi:signal transduction histidine kinase
MREGPIAFPMLLECDCSGRVLWMSERARSALGNPRHLMDLPSRLRFWRVWESPARVLMGIQPIEQESREIDDLLALERNSLKAYFRLLRRQRLLAKLTAAGRQESGLRQVERERKRLGRELHTGIGQSLVAIRLQLEIVQRELPAATGAAANALGRISSLAEQALEQVRGISHRLHPPQWQTLTLESAIRQVWELSGIPERFDAVLHTDALDSEPVLEVKILLYRAFQEALSNVARHSQASRVEAALRRLGDTLILSIHDNGIGFDVSQPASASGGIGIRSMREAAHELGGNFTLNSGPDGTTIDISVALAQIDR